MICSDDAIWAVNSLRLDSRLSEARQSTDQGPTFDCRALVVLYARARALPLIINGAHGAYGAYEAHEAYGAYEAYGAHRPH